MLTKCRPTQCRRASSLMPNLCRILAIPHPSPSPPSLHHSSASPTQTRASSSNSRWKSRQGGDPFVREARVRGLKSRAAFKLLEIDSQHKIFHRSATVVDLGYAPGSWSQVAKDRVGPYGIVVGIDLLPHQPPPGVSTIQGDFLNPAVQEMAKGFILEATRKKALERAERVEAAKLKQEEDREGETGEVEDGGDRKVGEEGRGSGGSDVVMEQKSYIEAERLAAREAAESESEMDENTAKEEKIVSVVLSDMSAPWPQIHGFSVNSLSNPYRRMMNTSGNRFRDQAGSMRLCDAAVQFASDVLKPGGNFVCKYYQGPDDKELEKKLRFLFKKVYRIKPESSRGESMEAFFVGIDRKPKALVEDYEAQQRKNAPVYDESDWE